MATAFYFTKAGIIIPTVSGTISFLSSSTIMYIIARSKSGIKTAYHRIILGLSIADCITSFVILLTTIPMPKNVIYPFALASYGNVATCEAQGLIYIIGNAACFCMNGILNIYYLCSLRFNMPEKRFRYYLEIPLYIVTLLTSIGVPCARLINKQILNPSPTDPYCVPNSYPAGCTIEDNPDCRGGGGGRDEFLTGYLATLSIATFTLLATMTLIIHSFYRNERKLRKAVKDKQIQEDDEGFQALLYAQKTSGIITRQALLYIAAFLIAWIFGFFEFLWQAEVIELTDQGARTLSTLRVMLQPLQGFFNLMIFVYHKVHTLRNADESLTLSEAFAKIFLFAGDMEDQAVFSNLNMVVDDYIGKLHLSRNRITNRVTNKNQELEVVDGDMEQSEAVLRRDGSWPQPEQSVGGIDFSEVQSGNEERDADISFVSSNVRSLNPAGKRPSAELFDDNGMSYSESQTIKDKLSGFSFSSATVKW